MIKYKRFGRESIKLILKTELIRKGFLKSEMDESVAGVSNLQMTLSFDQQKELLLLQMEHEKLKQRSEGSKLVSTDFVLMHKSAFVDAHVRDV